MKHLGQKTDAVNLSFLPRRIDPHPNSDSVEAVEGKANSSTFLEDRPDGSSELGRRPVDLQETLTGFASVLYRTNASSICLIDLSR